jgi:hypothetical protein
MGIQVIHNRDDLFRLWVAGTGKVSQAAGKILTGAALPYHHFPPPAEWLEHHKQIGCPAADIFIVMDSRLSRSSGTSFPGFPDKLPVGLVKAYHRTFRIKGEFIGL